ncbi:hypothetical protein cypCar_00017037 [Cyprinus carpio]|nr:hypothetical protein cypCar_00017037 [Cyprinus carpio]
MSCWRSSDPIPQTCHREHFKCSYLFECIPLSWHCDGEVDCLDSLDEERCVSVVSGTMPPQTGCETGEYRCMKNSCIPALLRCDMVLDCPDGEDEYGCRKTNLFHIHHSCKTNKMKFSVSVSVAVKICDDGELVCEATADCVAYQSRCDDIVDCPPFNPDESSCYAVSVGLSVALILVVIATGVILFLLFQRRHSLKDSSLIDNEELNCSTFDLQKKGFRVSEIDREAPEKK